MSVKWDLVLPDIIVVLLQLLADICIIHIVACRAVYRQRLGKHVPTATNMHAAIEVLYMCVC
jgi:hypothetical protein